MLNEKQELLFKGLKEIKDREVQNSESFLSFPKNSPLEEEYKSLQSKLNSEEEIKAFLKVQNEVVETAIYRIMEMIDGYGTLQYPIDLVDKENRVSLREAGELHDGFMNYLYEHEE